MFGYVKYCVYLCDINLKQNIMTVEEIEKIDILFIGDKMHPRLFYIPTVGKFTIPENHHICDIFTLIHSEGIKLGFKNGQNSKMEEIRNCLDIYKD
jgi:hypothetical protein